MNLEIFNKPDPSGRMSREKYLLNNYKSEYDYIINFCEIHNIDNISFKEKVYLSINGLTSVPTCNNSNCNNIVKFKNTKVGYLEYCSTKCVSSDDTIKEKKKKNSLKKYGTEVPSQSDEIKDKIINTNLKKYGHNSPMGNAEVMYKSKRTLLRNHGVSNPSDCNFIVEKRVISFRKNISQYKESYKKTSIERYGVDHPWMNEEIHSKSIYNSILSKNKKLKKSIEKKLIHHPNYKLVSIDYSKYKREIFIKCSVCNMTYSINREDFHLRHKNKTTICTICNPVDSSQSGSEINLFEFIKDNYKSNIIQNSRSIISPYELDIYLPDLKIAFEFNGLYWHSESQKGKYYHRDKTIMCEDLGIELVHIWEDDWVYKNDIVKSIILNKINKTQNRIYARNCNIVEISDANISRSFLDNNHILGNCSSSIKLGLYNNDELVSIMCFTKKSDYYELVRFCNLLNTVVVGGSSKLFKSFNDKMKCNIVSYSDTSMFNGHLYNKLGFEHINTSSVNYKWVISKKREHKSKYRKDRLVKSGYDINKSESDIMIEDVGSYKIWDCGLKKWYYKQI